MDKLDRNEDDKDYFKEFTNFSDIPADYMRKTIRETMFPNHYDSEILSQLTKCLRVFPHDQNTSGFFITIIKKIKDFDSNMEFLDDDDEASKNKKEEKKN